MATQSSAAATSDARIVRTKAALHDALLALLEEKPFDAITVRDLSARAGIGYATFFRHYASKAALLDDVAADDIRELLDLGLAQLETVDTRAGAETFFRHVDEKRALWSALLTGGAAGRMREEFIRQAGAQASVIAPAQQNNGSWLPEDLKVIFGVGAAVEILAWWLYRGRDYSVEQAAEILDRLVVSPMMNAP
jgi:AcrR family transcriptional regulator